MKNSLTVAYITSRPDPKLDWFLASLMKQLNRGDRVKIVVVMNKSPEFSPTNWNTLSGVPILFCRPKPTIWQGLHRLTSRDWWAASNARNTALCLADTEWIWWLDDRSVLAPGCVDYVRCAMENGYGICGAYQKRHHMRVENGEIVDQGQIVANDHRAEHVRATGIDIPPIINGAWCYGCSIALPVEWALQVGGFEEALDGMSAEDTAFGAMLFNNGHQMRYDPRMLMIEDRTPGETGEVMKREDKGKSPEDKSHRAIDLFHTAKNTSNRHQLLMSRQAVHSGRPFPVLLGSREDWYDGEQINEGYMSK